MGVGEEVKVRFARADDLAWCEEQDALVAREVVEDKIERKEIIVAETEGRMVGYLRLEHLWSKVPFIGLVVVREEYRRQGVGRAILKFLEDCLRERGHRELWSSSQASEASAQAWHRAVGFEESGFLAGINEGGIGEVFFRKSLG